MGPHRVELGHWQWLLVLFCPTSVELDFGSLFDAMFTCQVLDHLSGASGSVLGHPVMMCQCDFRNGSCSARHRCGYWAQDQILCRVRKFSLQILRRLWKAPQFCRWFSGSRGWSLAWVNNATCGFAGIYAVLRWPRLGSWKGRMTLPNCRDLSDPQGQALVGVGSATFGRSLSMWSSAGQGLDSKFHVSCI